MDSLFARFNTSVYDVETEWALWPQSRRRYRPLARTYDRPAQIRLVDYLAAIAVCNGLPEEEGQPTAKDPGSNRSGGASGRTATGRCPGRIARTRGSSAPRAGSSQDQAKEASPEFDEHHERQ